MPGKQGGTAKPLKKPKSDKKELDEVNKIMIIKIFSFL